MATGGTGDVLAGLLGALLARGLEAWVAATAGVYTHGLAGDIAAQRTGLESLVAQDLIDALPEAIRRVGPAR
jgi:NAD(P)H-hydrate epimerase